MLIVIGNAEGGSLTYLQGKHGFLRREATYQNIETSFSVVSDF